MVKMVLRNLVSNALKFTEKGHVKIDCLMDNNSLVIRVSDTGIGMDKRKLKELFNPIEAQSEFGTERELGSGIGLIFCKDFIEKNGGKLEVQSIPGLGSTFNFTAKQSHSDSLLSA